MDSLTQAVLGAAVGEAVAGPRLGRRAAAWGAVAGTLPDLDVLAYPFLDPAGELIVHRGVTHGLAFGVVVGAALGWLGWRLARWRTAQTGREPGTVRMWVALWVLALVTHPLLDVFTVYGTQLLAPFSRHPFAVGSLFIIDPAVTVPLALGLGVGLQAQARGTVEGALAQAGIEAERVLVVAGPLSSLTWRGVAQADGQIHPFALHVIDPPWDVSFGPPLPVADLPPDLAASRTGETLRWFSRGWLARVPGDGLTVADVRFGRLGMDADDPWVFRWRIAPEPPYAFAQIPAAPAFEDGEWARLVAFIAGTDRRTRPRGPSYHPPPLPDSPP